MPNSHEAVLHSCYCNWNHSLVFFQSVDSSGLPCIMGSLPPSGNVIFSPQRSKKEKVKPGLWMCKTCWNCMVGLYLNCYQLPNQKADCTILGDSAGVKDTLGFFSALCTSQLVPLHRLEISSKYNCWMVWQLQFKNLLILEEVFVALWFSHSYNQGLNELFPVWLLTEVCVEGLMPVHSNNKCIFNLCVLSQDFLGVQQ